MWGFAAWFTTLWNDQHYIAVRVTWIQLRNTRHSSGAGSNDGLPLSLGHLDAVKCRCKSKQPSPDWGLSRLRLGQIHSSEQTKTELQKVFIICFVAALRVVSPRKRRKSPSRRVKLLFFPVLWAHLLLHPDFLGKFGLERRLGLHFRCNTGATAQDNQFAHFHTPDWWHRQGQDLGLRRRSQFFGSALEHSACGESGVPS